MLNSSIKWIIMEWFIVFCTFTGCYTSAPQSPPPRRSAAAQVSMNGQSFRACPEQPPMKSGRQSSVENRIWGLFPWGYPNSSMVMEKPSINGCKLGVPPLQETAILPKYYQYKMTSVGQEIEVWETMGSRWVDSTLGMITRIIATSNNHKTLPSMDRNLSWLAAEKIQQVIFYPCISYIHYFPCMANYFQIVVKPPSWAPENSSAGSVGNPTETSFSSGWNRCHLSRWIQTCLVPIFGVGTVWVPIISTNFGHGLPDMLARWITSDGLGWISIELTAWSEQLQESHSPALGRWPRPFTAPYGGPLQSRSGRKKSHIFFRKGMVLIEPCLKCWNRCTMCEGWSLIHPHTKSKTGPIWAGGPRRHWIKSTRIMTTDHQPVIYIMVAGTALNQQQYLAGEITHNHAAHTIDLFLALSCVRWSWMFWKKIFTWQKSLGAA